jgi:hypothetical protein
MANWIQGAHLKKGAFTAKAKAAGKGVQEYASQVVTKHKKGEGSGGKLLKQALLAKTFSKMARG